MRNTLPALTDLPTISQGSHPAPGPLDVDVWRHYHGAGMGDERIVALLALLSPDEHERMACLRDDRRRRNFLVGRALCRHVLSRYAPVRPQDWRFGLGSRGKPSIIAPVLSSPLWFSLSHADGVSVCAVTGAGPEIGIDIERSALGRDALEVAEQFFPDAEVGALRALSPAMRGEAFMRLWALKESIVKARETSLGDGLCGTAFDLSRLDDIGVAFAESLHEREKPWQFRLFQLDKGLIVALALHTHATGPLRLHSAICVPQ
ncbi:4'-phosphopantetheinyl transferase superfamily protein [Novosphingobium sp. CCH12-A3]|uniref:4'-phosphopantetheinyl transferase family protein n=1 Tax=Novosphingobium sp. CCH12-A3 TaxID=1768752 RepID=UPI000784FABB|nr:4'-phosphopantetheinyl transferase superfamily protein [Novosphingobium sp. CCH12-A3]